MDTERPHGGALQNLLEAVKRREAWLSENHLSIPQVLRELRFVLFDAINPPPPESRETFDRPEDDVRDEAYKSFGPPVGVTKPGYFQLAHTQKELNKFLREGWRIYGV